MLTYSPLEPAYGGAVVRSEGGGGRGGDGGDGYGVGGEGEYPSWLGGLLSAESLSLANTVLGLGQVLSCVVVFFIHAMEQGPLRVRKRYREATGIDHHQMVSKMKGDWCLAARCVTSRDTHPADTVTMRLMSTPTLLMRPTPPDPPTHRYWIVTPYYLLTDGKLLFYVFAFVAAVAGLLYSPLFFSFHLLDMVSCHIRESRRVPY